jgi:hypothetical protein
MHDSMKEDWPAETGRSNWEKYLQLSGSSVGSSKIDLPQVKIIKFGYGYKMIVVLMPTSAVNIKCH